MSGDAYLRSVAATLTPTRDAHSLISRERGAIEGWLKSRLDAYHLFETGSWSHGTATTVSDVDYFAWLPAPRTRLSSTVLEQVRGELAFWYRDRTDVEVRTNVPAVQVHFTSKDLPDVEIVPAYWNDGDDFFIPDPGGEEGWIKSNPPAHKEYVNSAQKKDDEAKALIRMMKGWALMNTVPIRSLYLEMRAAKRVLDTPPVAPLLDMAWLLRDMSTSRLAAMNDPSKYDGRRITASDDTYSLIAAVLKVDEATTIADRALGYDRDGYDALAQAELQRLFNVA